MNKIYIIDQYPSENIKKNIALWLKDKLHIVRIEDVKTDIEKNKLFSIETKEFLGKHVESTEKLKITWMSFECFE